VSPTNDTRAARKLKQALHSIELTPDQVSKLTEACHSVLSDPPSGMNADSILLKIDTLLSLARASATSHSEPDMDVRALQRHAAVLLRRCRTSLNPHP